MLTAVLKDEGRKQVEDQEYLAVCEAAELKEKGNCTTKMWKQKHPFPSKLGLKVLAVARSQGTEFIALRSKHNCGLENKQKHLQARWEGRGEQRACCTLRSWGGEFWDLRIYTAGFP